MNLDDIKKSRYLTFSDRNVLLSRLVYIFHNIELIEENDSQAIYNLEVSDCMQNTLYIKLYNDKKNNRFRANLTNTNLYELTKASSSIADILSSGDYVVYKLPDREDRFKVLVKIYAHNHIVCYCNNNDNEHGHNLKTMLSRWAEEYIVGVYTYDQKRQLKA